MKYLLIVFTLLMACTEPRTVKQLRVVDTDASLNYTLSCDTVITCDTIWADTTVPRPIMAFGSSTIAQWNIQTAFPSYPMKKAGYGGKKWADLILLTDTIKNVNAKQVLIYSGDNDIIARRRVGDMTTDVANLMKKVWADNPDIHITFMKTKPSDTAFKILYPDGITTGIAAIESTNKNIINWATAYKPAQFSVIDSYSIFLLWNPKRLNTSLYQADLLHLNQSAGYPKLNTATQPMLLP